MLAQLLIVTFIFCLGLAAACVLVARQWLVTYVSVFVRHFFYYLAAFFAFAFYGLWGQILARALLAALDTDAAVVEAVAGFVPVLGVPFLLMSWAMLLAMAASLFGKDLPPAWHALHGLALLVLLVGAWLAVSRLQTAPEPLGFLEGAALIGIELVYFAVFLALAWRFGSGYDAGKRRVLLTFAGLLFGGFVARALFAGLVLVDLRLGALSLLAFFASNVPALLYLRANADRVLAPAKAEQATKAGVEHVLDRYGVTRRERQIVEHICLGKTNKQIAEELFISLQTVKDHTHRIYSKLGIGSRMQLVQLMNAAK